MGKDQTVTGSFLGFFRKVVRGEEYKASAVQLVPHREIVRILREGTTRKEKGGEIGMMIVLSQARLFTKQKKQ